MLTFCNHLASIARCAGDGGLPSLSPEGNLSIVRCGVHREVCLSHTPGDFGRPQGRLREDPTGRHVLPLALRPCSGSSALVRAGRGAAQTRPVRRPIACYRMVLVTERVHPRSLNFYNQRRLVTLRDVHGYSWETIAGMVWNLQKERPTWKTCAETYERFNKCKGRRQYNYKNCGRRPTLTKELQKWVIKRLLALRRKCICTSTMLQRELAQEKAVTVEASTIRRVLAAHGYKWLRRSQKPKYSAEVRAERKAFAEYILSLSAEDLRDQLALAMDGVVLSVPPTDTVARENFCRSGETHIWRKPSERECPEIDGADHYSKQVPLSRAVPLWGGVSEGGFAEVLWHPEKKLKAEEWAEAVRGGALKTAILKLNPPRRRGPWRVLCDNETFLRAPVSRTAYERVGVELWSPRLPPKSPDLNPVERFWSWLRRQLRAKDLADLAAKRPPVTKAGFKLRVRSLIRTQKAQRVAANCAKGWRKVAQEVVRRKGAASRG